MIDQGGIKTGKRGGIWAVISAVLVSWLLVFWPGMSFALPQYGVHVSSFRNQENAEAEIADYRSRGLEAYAVYETVPDKGLWYRVYLGRFNSYNSAAAAGQRLMGQGIIDYYDIGRVEGSVLGNHTTLKAKSDTFDQDLLYPSQVGTRSTSQGKFEPIETAPADPQEAAGIKRRLYQQDVPNVAGPRTRPYTPAPPLQDPVNQGAPTGRFDSLLDQPPVEASQRPSVPNRVPPQPVEPPVQNGRFSDPFAKIPPDVMAQLREPVEEEGNIRTEESTFSLSAKTGMAFWPQSSNFSVLRSSGTTLDRWYIDDNDARGFHHAIVGSLNLWEFLNVDASIEKEIANNLDLWYLTLGPRASFRFPNDMSIYFKNCLAFGFLNWDGLPGDFENGIGLDWGLGFDYNVGRLTIGAELLYRWINYDYNAPSNVLASSDQLDFTGFVLSWSIGYLF